MGYTQKELIEFMDELVELSSEGNRIKAELKKDSYLPSHNIAAIPDSVQEEIKQKVIAALTEHGECTPENIDRAMCSKLYELKDLIDIREYSRRIEEGQRAKAEEKRKGGR